MQCVILAGGLATRLRPLTENLPKALIQINGRPFIDLQLTSLKKGGVTKAVLSLGFQSDQIKSYVGNGEKWGLEIAFVDEGKDLMGTGGAIRLAYDKGVLDDAFLVIYGDSYLPIEYSAVWAEFISQPLPALMTVFRNEGKWDTSNVWYEDGKIQLYDKHGKHPESKSHLKYIDYGLSAFRKDCIKTNIPSGQKTDLAGLLYALSQQGLLAGFEAETRFYEIGSQEGIKDLSGFLS